jgi:hypothetical protein
MMHRRSRIQTHTERPNALIEKATGLAAFAYLGALVTDALESSLEAPLTVACLAAFTVAGVAVLRQDNE